MADGSTRKSPAGVPDLCCLRPPETLGRPALKKVPDEELLIERFESFAGTEPERSFLRSSTPPCPPSIYRL